MAKPGIKAGNLTKKQNVFDDFAACARYLIDHKYTNPAKLAIEGGSNGGLLMGAALTQHPELFARGRFARRNLRHAARRAATEWRVQCHGIRHGEGARPVPRPVCLLALPSRGGRDQYPAVLFLTGDNDPRVDPLNSRKMTARLQASGTKHPVLLRTSSNSGHGIGTALSEYLAEQADVQAFLFDQLGVK